jgi:hypothetical protein
MLQQVAKATAKRARCKFEPRGAVMPPSEIAPAAEDHAGVDAAEAEPYRVAVEHPGARKQTKR